MLFVLSTKTTKERFLLKLCQRNGNEKRIALSGLFLAESSSEEDEKVSASEEEAVPETESANEIQENVESSYSDDSSTDEAKRRKTAANPKPAPSSLTVTKSSKKALKISNKRKKSLSERWTDSLFPVERRLISPQYSGVLSISLRFHCLSPETFCLAFSHAKPPRNIHAAREVTLSRF